MIDSSALTARLRAPFSKLLGNTLSRFQKYGANNDFVYRALNRAGTNELDLIGTDALDNILIGGAKWSSIATPLSFNLSANGKLVTQAFFVNANDVTPLEIVNIKCTFGTADGATNTAIITKETTGVAPGSGQSCMTGSFNMNATANTVQTATLAGNRGFPSLVLNAGEQLSFKIASAVTSLANVLIEVYVRPSTGTRIAQYYRNANGDIATGVMDLNIIPGTTVRAVSMRWLTAGTDAGAVTADVTIDPSGTAPGAGTSVLAAAQSVKGTPNVTVFPALTATAANLVMPIGSTLSVKITGTTTAATGLVVTVFYNAITDQTLIIPFSLWDAQATSRNIFLAGSTYAVEDCWMTWSTGSTSNTQLLTKDTGTTAPGGGTGLQTDNTNAGILTSGTANTPIGSLLLTAVSTKPTLMVGNGDRLSLKDAGTTGPLAGAFGVVRLKKI